jgi:hypothetical protein
MDCKGFLSTCFLRYTTTYIFGAKLLSAAKSRNRAPFDGIVVMVSAWQTKYTNYALLGYEYMTTHALNFLGCLITCGVLLV